MAPMTAAAAAAEEPTITQEQSEPTLPSAEQQLVQIDMSPPNSGTADQLISSLQYAASGEFEASLEAIMTENDTQSAPESADVSPPHATQRTGRGRGQTRSAASRTLSASKRLKSEPRERPPAMPSSQPDSGRTTPSYLRSDDGIRPHRRTVPGTSSTQWTDVNPMSIPTTGADFGETAATRSRASGCNVKDRGSVRPPSEGNRGTQSSEGIVQGKGGEYRKGNRRCKGNGTWSARTYDTRSRSHQSSSYRHCHCPACTV